MVANVKFPWPTRKADFKSLKNQTSAFWGKIFSLSPLAPCSPGAMLWVRDLFTFPFGMGFFKKHYSFESIRCGWIKHLQMPASSWNIIPKTVVSEPLLLYVSNRWSLNVNRWWWFWIVSFQNNPQHVVFFTNVKNVTLITCFWFFLHRNPEEDVADCEKGLLSQWALSASH